MLQKILLLRHGNLTALHTIFKSLSAKHCKHPFLIIFPIIVLSMFVCVFLNRILKNITSIMWWYESKYFRVDSVWLCNVVSKNLCFCLSRCKHWKHGFLISSPWQEFSQNLRFQWCWWLYKRSECVKKALFEAMLKY